MKILFSSDLHGNLGAYRDFSDRLKDGFDIGILAGDLLDEFVPLGEAQKYGNPQSPNRRGLELKKQEVLGILAGSGKPVLYVRGNHDIVGWEDLGLVRCIENKAVEIGGYRFIGTESAFNGIHSSVTSYPAIEPLINDRTILVSHVPPFGSLDITEETIGGRRVKHHIGSRPLRGLVERTKPLYCLFGHVHEQFGRRENLVNGSWFLARRFVELVLPSVSPGLHPVTREAGEGGFPAFRRPAGPPVTARLPGG